MAGSQAPAWEPAWVQSSALRATGNLSMIFLLPSWSLAPKGVPKRELGNERISEPKAYSSAAGAASSKLHSSRGQRIFLPFFISQGNWH